ncbi:hypothetical protein [Streptosporangium sp. NPDC006930]|uniref:hypothetical protein n=1 Tax=Streptosporangium sp. NPDC006930 TaxID=3154783 RepID=UPI00342BBBAE
MATKMKFHGMEEWSDNFPRVDFSTPKGIVDLHNNANFIEMDFHPSKSRIIFKFKYASDWRLIEEQGIFVNLTFDGVHDLIIRQAPDFDPLAATTLESIVRDMQSEVSTFSVDLGDVLCFLSASSLTLTFSDTEGGATI